MSRYSLLNIHQAAALADSERARYRLGRLLLHVLTDFSIPSFDLERFLQAELGIPLNINGFSSWGRYFDKSRDLLDLLDSITLIHAFLNRDAPPAAALWKQDTQRIFQEERLAYEIDQACLVHPAVDPEFQRNRQATIAALQMPRYANSLAAFSRVSDELMAEPPNGKDAWRAVFTAVEGLFRLMFQSAPQLNAGAVDTHLSMLMQRLYATDPVALRAANKLLASFKDWVDASHNYRHEPGSEDPVQPPIDLAILAISNGAGFLRWLITLDQANLAAK